MRSADDDDSSTLSTAPPLRVSAGWEASVTKPYWVPVTILIVGLWTITSPVHARLVKACDVENPPPNCETMWAVVAHVSLPRQPIAAVNPPPRCQTNFEAINWGKLVADALVAEADRAALKNLAMDVSDAGTTLPCSLLGR